LEPIGRQYDISFLKRLGWEIEEFFFACARGDDGENIWEMVKERLAMAHSIEQLIADRRSYALEQWHALPSLQPIAGIPELLERLDAANINVALASSASLQRIELFLNRLHLAHHGPIIVSADDIPHSKPAPDCYLRGAEILGIDPADCVAIEDAGTASHPRKLPA
jgi:beta-phosphoglucomutase-like phosphatase (HAD superfamily)